MVGKKKTYKPYSAAKLAVAVYNNVAARMGVLGTESPILQLHVYNYANAVAQNWNEIGSWASATYHNLVSQYNLTGLQRAALRALVGIAAKYVQKIKRGVKVDADTIRQDIQSKVSNLGVDLPGGVIDDIVSAVVGPTAATA